jgi:hypothetical protein
MAWPAVSMKTTELGIRSKWRRFIFHLCLSEKYQNRLHNERIFQLTWGHPREKKIMKGPAYVNWSMNSSPENEREAGTRSTGNAATAVNS